MSTEQQNQEEEKGRNMEIIIGLLVAFFGAVLAIAGIGAGKYGGNQLIAAAESNKAYAWYQSKSIKSTSLKAQKDLLVALTKSNAIKKEYVAGVDTFIEKLSKKSARYKKEMAEILKGSAKVGKENWIQDKDGKLGIIIGAEEWEVKSELLGDVCDWFDYTNLFLNLCLVLGAICFVVQNDSTKKMFFYGMLLMGIIGSVLCAFSFYQAFQIP